MSAAKALPAGLQIPLAVASGVLTFIAFPGWDLHATAWFCLVPLLVAADGTTVRRGAWLGLLAGTTTNLGGFHWMTEMLREFGHLPVVACWAIVLLQAVTQGLTMALGIGLWRLLVRAGVGSGWSAFAAMFAGEAVVPMIFPWFLGNGIAHQTVMVQIADLGGVQLVSALLYATQAAIAELIAAARQRRAPSWRLVGGTLAAVALTYGYGTVRIAAVEQEAAAARKLRIGLVEGNIGIWEKEARHLSGDDRVRTLRKNLLTHQRLSAALEARGAELILWPESAYQPFGAVPVVFSADRFKVVGHGGTALRHDGRALVAMDRAAGFEGLGDLSGLSAPRADALRAIVDGRKVLTATAWSRTVTELPAGEVGVDTASPEIDLMNRLRPGYVLARSGRVWLLDFPAERVGRSGSAAAWQGTLSELAAIERPAMEATAIAVAGSQDVAVVGRGGAVLEVRGHALFRVDVGLKTDLWDVAGDPQGADLVAVGAEGVALARVGGRWRRERSGGADLYGVFFDGDGIAWAVGAAGTLLRRERGGRWSAVRTGRDDDLLAGAADARGHLLLLGRGGLALERDAAGVLRALASGTDRELTAVLGMQAQAAWMVPRAAQRVVPSRAALPDRALTFPADVAADEVVAEFDRSTPRRGFATPLLMGAMTFGGELAVRNADCEACYNSALLLDGDGRVLDLYDKAFLLMFGEYLPFGESFPELYDLLPESSRFQPGVRTEPMRLGDLRLGVLICYEDLLPAFAARVAAHQPHVLLNLTNDAWFGKTAEPYHHLQLAQMRAVEYRRWLVRSTNTGVSVFIDAAGRRVAETGLDDAETLLQAVPMLEGRTVYARLGNWTPLAMLCWTLLLWGRAVRGGGGGPKGPRNAKPRRKPAGRSRAKRGAAGDERETLEPQRLG